MAGRLDTDSLLLLHDALARLEQGFVQLPPIDTTPADPVALREVLNEVADRLRDNYPYFHPLYAGQMLKPPHPVARLAYALAMWINPNNHALDGGRASSAMEKEAVAEIARMFGWDDAPRPPHAAAARWRTSRRCGSRASSSPARPSSPRRRRTTRTAASAPCSGCRSRASRADARGRMDVGALERAPRGAAASARSSRRSARRRPAPWIRCAEILALRERHGFRVHADAAYGGYYALADNLAPPARARVRPHRRGRFDRDRSAQARAAALRLRLRAVPRSRRRPPLPARLALHLLQLEGAAPRRDQPRMLAPGRGRGRAVGDAEAPAARARRRVRTDGSTTAGPRRSRSTSSCARTRASSRPFRPSSTSSSGPCARSRPPSRPPARARSSRRPKRPACISRSPSCPRRSSAIPGGRAAHVTALRSVLMKPEHRGALPAIGRLLSDSTG